MIPARPAFWADWLFRHYVTWLCRRRFHALHLLGELPETDPATPLLLLPNHSTWWDGFFVYLLNRKWLRRPLYMMMLERQLRRYHFFARLGAFSIDPGSVRGTRAALRYARHLLQQPTIPATLLCVFPQGELAPWARRPLGYKRGLEVMLQHFPGEITLLPLAIRAEFLLEQRPRVFLLFGKPVTAGGPRPFKVAHLEEITTRLLEELQQRILAGERGTTLLARRRGNESLRSPAA